MSGFDDEKFNDDSPGTITDDNYIDPYSGKDDDKETNVKSDPEIDLTEEDIKEEGKGEPEDNEYIPIDERNSPFDEAERQLLLESRRKKLLLAIGVIGGFLWLS